MKWRLYRLGMRLLHRFNLHYAPPNLALKNSHGWPLHVCQWCGLRDHVMPPLSPEEAGLPIDIIARRGSPSSGA